MDDILFEDKGKFEKRIRLTKTIYQKILQRHPEFSSKDYLKDIKEAIVEPEYIIKGWTNEYLALSWCKAAPGGPKYICVVYRELDDEGFIITAFFISQYERLLRRETVWHKK